MLRHLLISLAVCTCLSSNLHAADASDDGRKAFSRCTSCHAVSGVKGGDFGPNLDGVFGKPVGHVDGYSYSTGMKKARDAGMVWDEAALDAYIRNPSKLIRSSLKSIPGIRDAGIRQRIIAFLKANSTP